MMSTDPRWIDFLNFDEPRATNQATPSAPQDQAQVEDRESPDAAKHTAGKAYPGIGRLPTSEPEVSVHLLRTELQLILWYRCRSE